jgi:hypothetical protein
MAGMTDRNGANAGSDTPAAAEGGQARWTWQFGVAVGLLVGFGVLVVVMMTMADGNDTAWQRRVYLFGAVQALVFTAIGWLFGREVHRSEAQTARRDAEAAQREAQGAREDARGNAAAAAAAQQEAVEERTKGRAVQAAVHSATDAPRETGGAGDAGGGPGDAGYGDERAPAHARHALLDLRAMVDELYGPQST